MDVIINAVAGSIVRLHFKVAIPSHHQMSSWVEMTKRVNVHLFQEGI